MERKIRREKEKGATTQQGKKGERGKRGGEKQANFHELRWWIGQILLLSQLSISYSTFGIPPSHSFHFRRGRILTEEALVIFLLFVRFIFDTKIRLRIGSLICLTYTRLVGSSKIESKKVDIAPDWWVFAPATIDVPSIYLELGC